MNLHRTWGRTPYKGVSWAKQCNKWRAEIRKGRKHYHLGYFRFELDAAVAYDDAARRLFGKYAALNFPGPGEQGVIFPDDAPKEAFISARVMS